MSLIPATRSGTAGGAVYVLLDRGVRAGRFVNYRLQAVDLTGKPSWYGSGSVPVR